jgi:hypothetical protein
MRLEPDRQPNSNMIGRRQAITRQLTLLGSPSQQRKLPGDGD